MISLDVVDPDGNINFIRGEGLVIIFQEIDDSSSIVEPSTHERRFRIPQLGYDAEVGVDPNDSTSYRIILTEDLLAQVGSSREAFSLIDPTGEVIVTLWAGVIQQVNPF